MTTEEVVLRAKLYNRVMTFFASTVNAPSDMDEAVVREMVNGLSHDIAWIFEADQATVLEDLKAQISGAELPRSLEAPESSGDGSM
jgi:hypothetical protein